MDVVIKTLIALKATPLPDLKEYLHIWAHQKISEQNIAISTPFNLVDDTIKPWELLIANIKCHVHVFHMAPT
jgi:hypothetical protein